MESEGMQCRRRFFTGCNLEALVVFEIEIYFLFCFVLSKSIKQFYFLKQCKCVLRMGHLKFTTLRWVEFSIIIMTGCENSLLHNHQSVCQLCGDGRPTPRRAVLPSSVSPFTIVTRSRQHLPQTDPSEASHHCVVRELHTTVLSWS